MEWLAYASLCCLTQGPLNAGLVLNGLDVGSVFLGCVK